MSLLALGINHQTAALEIRERFAFTREQIPNLLSQLIDEEIREAVLLSTCNRTELYCEAEHGERVIEKLAHICQVNDLDFSNAWYLHHEEAALKHLVRVATGLDSMVLGEPQILGQVKEAYEVAQQAGTVGALLHRIFQHCFFLSKKIRSETAIGKNSISVAYTAVSLAKHIFANLAKCRITLLGAGETAELAARHFAELGATKFSFVNRSYENAHRLALAFQGEAFELMELPIVLQNADIIVAATESPTPLVTAPMLKKILENRSRQPILLIDLAVPRNIDPAIVDLPDCYLYSVDDLQAIVLDSLEQRRDAAEIAEDIIQLDVAHFFRKQKIATHGKSIENFNEQMELLLLKFSSEVESLTNHGDVITSAKKLAKQMQHQAIKFLQQNLETK